VHSSNARRATDRNPRHARTGQSVNTDSGLGDATVNGRDPRQAAHPDDANKFSQAISIDLKTFALFE